MRYIVLFILLTACQQPVFSDVLPVFSEYSPQEQAKMAEEFDALPADSSLRRPLRDCRALRDEIRAAHQP